MRKVKLVENEYYHIYNRGIGKQKIFYDHEDYQRFLKLLYIFNNSSKVKFKDLLKHNKNIFEIERGNELVKVCCYVLMPNHFHILLTSPFVGGGDKISLFIQKVTAGYTLYYNKKHKRSGSLFEGTFKSEVVSSDNYLKYLFSYIHLNPIKIFQPDWKDKGIKNFDKALTFLQKYSYSSYQNFLQPFEDLGGQGRILDLAGFLKILPKNFNFKKEIFQWLTLKFSPPSKKGD